MNPSPAGDAPVPAPGLRAVDIWRAPLAPEIAGDGLSAAPLSPEERRRAARYRDPAAGLRFVRSRVLLRSVLAGHLGAEPAEVVLRDGAAGKPALAGPWAGAGWHFNVAHSGALWLCAVARGMEVGVDVEALRPLPEADRIARPHLSPAEWAEYGALPAAERPAALLRAWTRKEACVKAEGLGLRRPLREIEVTFGPGVPGRLRAVAGAPPPAGWSLRAWVPLPGFTAALVLTAGAAAMRHRAWPEDAPRP